MSYFNCYISFINFSNVNCFSELKKLTNFLSPITSIPGNTEILQVINLNWKRTLTLTRDKMFPSVLFTVNVLMFYIYRFPFFKNRIDKRAIYEDEWSECFCGSNTHVRFSRNFKCYVDKSLGYLWEIIRQLYVDSAYPNKCFQFDIKCLRRYGKYIRRFAEWNSNYYVAVRRCLPTIYIKLF